METVVASEAWRFLRCPGSHFLEGVRTYSEAGALGTAAHAVASAYIHPAPGTANGWDVVEKIAQVHGVPIDDLKTLTFGIQALWEEFGPHFPKPQTEIGMGTEFQVERRFKDEKGKWHRDASTFQLTGYADVLSNPGDGTLRIADWKTGFKQDTPTDQLVAYAACASQRYPDVAKVWVATFWVRERAIESQWVTQEEIALFRDRMVSAYKQALKGSLRMGAHCENCPATVVCPALKTALMPLAKGDVTVASVIEAYQAMKAWSKTLENAEVSIRALLAAAPDHQITDGDKTLAFVPGRERQSIDTEKAWDTVTDHLLSPEALMSAIKFTKGDLLDEVMAQASYGNKKAAADAFMAKLKEAGAVNVTQERDRLVVLENRGQTLVKVDGQPYIQISKGVSENAA